MGHNQLREDLKWWIKSKRMHLEADSMYSLGLLSHDERMRAMGRFGGLLEGLDELEEWLEEWGKKK